MIIWIFLGAAVLFFATIALLRFTLVSKQTKELRSAIDSVKQDLIPTTARILEETARIRARIEELKESR